MLGGDVKIELARPSVCCSQSPPATTDGFGSLYLEMFNDRGLPFSTYTPRGKGGGQVSYTFPLRITCKKGGGGPDSM